MSLLERGFYDQSETESEYSDDSQEDPNFDVLEETRLPLSNLSIKRKVKIDNALGTDGNQEEAELDEKDQKGYEIVHKIIEGGQLEKLKVEDCKIYLRKHGLRLSGNKETLIQRIKEHLDIVNGGGEKKYPVSSFVLNCKGDACTGDVVIFEQNVYEEFNIASRSAKGGPSGTRVIAGRILKESYGAAKQQHTFTIEVLWSKGEKPLPPLHPLLIKGRNLYRLKTMRQKWEDEGERQKILLEKHARGGNARLNREARVQQRETQKLQKQTRATRNEHVKGKQEEEKRDRLRCYTTTCELNIPIQSLNLHGIPDDTSNAHVVPVHQRLMNMNCSFQTGHHTASQLPNFYSSKSSSQHVNYHCARSPIQRHPLSFFPNSNHVKIPVQQHTFNENWVRPYSQQSHVQKVNASRNPPGQQQKCNEQKQKCKYFVQGRCYFGDRCKFLHEFRGNE